MRRRLVAALFLFAMAKPTVISWAQQPGVISPEELETAKIIERNTYQDEQYGFSITKPEEWAMYVDGALPTWTGIFLTPDSTKKSTASSKEDLVALMRFPSDTQWVLVNPRLLVQVYETTGPMTQGEIMDYALRAAQAGRQLSTQVVFPPAAFRIGDNEWMKAGLFAKLPADTDPNKLVDVYIELYVHALTDSRFFYIQFIGRSEDVPLYRNDIDHMIQSMRITEPVSGSHHGATRTEL